MSWLVARIKFGEATPGFALRSLSLSQGRLRRTAEGGCPYINLYAVLLGRIVKSRTWVRMLDICIPFSCETNGRISAMN
jgi:hypothetical protein